MAEVKKGRDDRLNEFNSLPDILKEWRYGDTKVELQKTEGQVDKLDPETIRAHLKVVILPESGEALEFEPEDYITTFGARAMSKFIATLGPYIGDIAKQIAPDLLKFREARGQIAEKYGIEHPGVHLVRMPMVRRGQQPVGGAVTTE